MRPLSKATLAFAALAAPLLAASAGAQDRVILRSGEKIEGRVLGEDGEDLRIEVGFGEVRIRSRHVVRVESTRGGTPAAPLFRIEPTTRPRAAAAGAPDPASAGDAGSRAPDGARGTPAVPADVARGRRDRATFDDRVESVLSRYLWFVPTGGFRIGFGAALVVVATLLTFFSSRLAGLETRSLGRSLVFSVSLLGVVGLGGHLAAPSAVGIALFSLLAILAWFTLARGLLGAGFRKGTVLLACFLFSLLLVVVWVEVVGFAVRPNGPA